MQVISELKSVTEPTRDIRILLVEDQEVLRLGLKLALGTRKGFEIVGEAKNGREAIELAKELSPDVILMDIEIPILDGISATRILKEVSKCHILILSGHDEDDYLFPALEAGADGYCLKDTSNEALKSAIIAVAGGGTWLDHSIARRVLQKANSNERSINRSGSKLLSELEKSILSSLLSGKSADIIASEFKIDKNEVHDLTRAVLMKSSLKKNMSVHSTGEKIAPKRITYEHELTKKCSMCNSKVPLSEEFCPDDGKPAVFDELIGSEFAERYEILSLIGSGTGGAVYKAKHIYMGKLVAIKILHSNLMNNIDLLQRFRQEASLVSQLNHYNIVSVLDFGLTDDGTAFMIMDYAEPVSLDSLIKEEGSINSGIALEIFKQICDGMQAAHDQNILHRDLKPSNILVSNYGKKNMRVLIADFGTAKIINESNSKIGQLVKTEMGQIFGTPLYMSPEQCQGASTSMSSDIYSLGCLMFYTLTGYPPFVGKDVFDVMYKHVNCDPVHLKEFSKEKTIPELLQAIVMKALNKKEADRYRSMKELKFYLEGVPTDELSR